MAGAWNEGDWGLGNFGQQNNVTIPVTSVVDTPLAWNVGNFGGATWGGQFDNIGITLGNETTAGEINEGWGRLTWGENAWGGTGDVIVLGNQINISTGTVTFKIDSLPSVTGLQLNTSLDSVQAFGLAIVDVTGQQLNISEGIADASPDALVTGQQLNISSLGNVTVTAEINSGWGRLTWGQNDWNSDGISQIIQVSNTGLGLNVNSGIREYWGQDAWGASTTEWGGSYVTETIISATVEVSSIAMTISEGEVDPGPDATSAEDPELLIKSPPAATTIVLLLPVAVKETPELIVTLPLDAGDKILISPAIDMEEPTVIALVLVDFPNLNPVKVCPSLL